jgi:putative endonuclease
MQRGGCVYILTNKHHTVLYTGVTSDLISRVQQHIFKLHPKGFTANTTLTNLFITAFFQPSRKPLLKKRELKAEAGKRKLT